MLNTLKGKVFVHTAIGMEGGNTKHSRYSLLPDYSNLLLLEEEDSMVSADICYSLRWQKPV